MAKEITILILANTASNMRAAQRRYKNAWLKSREIKEKFLQLARQAELDCINQKKAFIAQADYKEFERGIVTDSYRLVDAIDELLELQAKAFEHLRIYPSRVDEPCVKSARDKEQEFDELIKSFQGEQKNLF